MSIETLAIGAPFIVIRVLRDEMIYKINNRTIALNLSQKPLRVRQQSLGELQSVILNDTEMQDVSHAVVIEDFANHGDDAVLMSRIRKVWPLAFQIRGEERLRGVEHYMSPKVWVGQFGFTLYHSASVPLNVGLHRDHNFCPVEGFREVHTQIIGLGKMQQFREQDVNTLYLEEFMAPGTTHRPMYDAQGNYPWHQFETVTPSVFMAVEILPDGVLPPSL